MPILITQRLQLKPIQKEDLSYILLLYRNDDVMEYFGASQPSKLSSIVSSVKRWSDRWNKSPFSWFCIFSLRSNEFIGACGIAPPNQNGECEIAYLLVRKYWGNGYATESVQELLRYAFKDTLDQDGKATCLKVYATVRIENSSSEKVLKKLGMTKVGESSLRFQHERFRYEITLDEYLKHKQIHPNNGLTDSN